MIQIATAVENDLFNTSIGSFLTNNFAKSGSAFNGCPTLLGCLKVWTEGRNSNERLVGNVVNNLRINIGVAARNAQTRTLRGARNLAAYAGVTAA